ncbi:sulfatase-like hydrolase/transferase [Verrucomicrobiaceae bacterium 5K15]|uniref:Sulfatase-like hydrolase/transferase n=1 Tax=Oceaniferula flava TaxID=2800421 RepID=A0AAE2SAG5_9BACT|nr:sulfatase-like hydrolase/transferase [Oceaniferula flavus]MBK1853337.1 sulfatase-like hydrolase/transferase [Oceaniferula flavus]MBM1134642.1 sulfatase-like hydrolase/transferase [Oceaniferula flavus]
MLPLIRISLLLVGCLVPLSLTASDKPNLLIILADDMGYGDLSCYGSKQVPTPNLDALAAEGVRCTDGYVSASVCAPSRAGLLTGRYQNRIGFEHNLGSVKELHDEYEGISLKQPLLSDRLKQIGYHTGIIGKWHLGKAVPEMHPNQRGFDYFFGMLDGHHHYWPTPTNNKLTLNGNKVTKIRTPYLTDWFTLEAKDYIERHSQDDQPWFLYLSYNTPHSPMQAKDEDLAKFDHIQDKTRRIYCAMQHNMDRNIGTIIAKLKELGQLENTLIVFLSDNGGSVEVSHAINAPLRGGKGSNLEGGVRVPTIYHWPTHLPKGKTYTEPVISLDILPTFMAAAGAEVPRTQPLGSSAKGDKGRHVTDGVDLLPYLRGERKGRPHRALFWRITLRAKSVRSGNWKLLIPAHSEPELYQLAEDPSELNNLYREQPEMAKKLRDRLREWETSLEMNPLWMSDNHWFKYNHKLYTRKFMLKQPEKDDPRDFWSFGALKENIK